MSVTIIHDYRLDGDKDEAMAAAAELVEAFREDPAVQLSLWVEDENDDRHHFHVTVFDTMEDLKRWTETDAIKRFVARFYPQMDESTHEYPAGEVLLAGGSGVRAVAWRGAS